MNNREKVESIITEHLKAVWEIYKSYNPSGKYLSIAITDGKYLFCNNSYWDDDKETPIHFEEEFKND